MKVATILFTYNRPWHTQMVLESLSNSITLPEKMYIFHDGKKDTTNEEKWSKVETIIRNVDWCDCEVITSEINKGLADSVVLGINYVIANYDAVIVLEDDCVPHRMFMDYMIMSLNKYKNQKQVYCINASSEPVDVPPNGTDAYFIGRMNSWGWATWKDRWAYYDRDYRIIGEIKKNSEINEWNQIWGQDLEPTVLSNVQGETDSWAVFWALSIIRQKGLCLAPYKSFIDNIGFDGSGVHCGIGNSMLKLINPKKTSITLPDQVKIIDDYEQIFANYYPWIAPIKREIYYKNFLTKWVDIKIHGRHIGDWLIINEKKKISIWGMGKICDLLLNDIQSNIEVEFIVETTPQISEYKGIPVISPQNLTNTIDALVVIPGYDLKHIMCTIPKNMIEKILPIDILTG